MTLLSCEEKDNDLDSCDAAQQGLSESQVSEEQASEWFLLFWKEMLMCVGEVTPGGSKELEVDGFVVGLA